MDVNSIIDVNDYSAVIINFNVTLQHPSIHRYDQGGMLSLQFFDNMPHFQGYTINAILLIKSPPPSSGVYYQLNCIAKYTHELGGNIYE
jgi:hypothetical protein